MDGGGALPWTSPSHSAGDAPCQRGDLWSGPRLGDLEPGLACLMVLIGPLWWTLAIRAVPCHPMPVRWGPWACPGLSPSLEMVAVGAAPTDGVCCFQPDAAFR